MAETCTRAREKPSVEGERGPKPEPEVGGGCTGKEGLAPEDGIGWRAPGMIAVCL